MAQRRLFTYLLGVVANTFSSPDVNPHIRFGDCLTEVPVLRKQFGPFQLAYMDPPFNAGGTRKARQTRGERALGTAAYVDYWGGLDEFLAMLEPRLKVVYDALGPHGSLWLHLDYRAIHDCKVLLNKLFGRTHFAGEIIWVPGNGGKKRVGPSVTHQTILIYAKGDSLIWNGDDTSLRESFSGTSLKMHFKQTDEAGRHFRERHINGRTYRYYADEGRRIGSVWTDCPAMSANTPLTNETTGYPTQKPETLLERIIRASTLPGGSVLDPMCGSGTTLAVARKLGRGYAGSDQSPVAYGVATKRLAQVEAAHSLASTQARAS